MSEKKEYIERGALIEKLKEKITTNYLSLYDEDTLESIIRFAEKQPAADVEPVVRCKDCERWHKTESDTPNERYCSFMGKFTRSDFFCGRARAHTEMSGSGE